jgi:hypothetical protein
MQREVQPAARAAAPAQIDPLRKSLLVELIANLLFYSA